MPKLMRFRPIAGALLTLALVSQASAESAVESAVPTRYPPSSVRSKLLVGGLGLTGVAYGLAVMSGTLWPDVPGADALKVPVVGPWIALGQNDCAPDDPDCGAILYVRAILTVLDGLAQAGGLGIVGEALFMTTEAEPQETAGPSRALRLVSTSSASPALRVAPVATRHTTGLALFGQF